MPPKAAARKRNRKRKRRDASSSEASSSSSSESGDSPSRSVVKPIVPTSTLKAPSVSSSSSSSSSSSDSDSDSEPEKSKPALSPKQFVGQRKPIHRDSPSPSPPPTTEIPSFLPQQQPDTPVAEFVAVREHLAKEKFRKFWMASVAEGFKDDLEEIRKEPNLTTPRLALLIDSLASGSEVFTSHSTNENDVEMDEVAVILDTT